jgi:hypothetical protein
MRARGTPLIGAAVVVLSLAGCADDAVPDVPQARTCDEAQPLPRTDADDGEGAALVPTDSEPVAMTLCIFPIEAPDGSEPTVRAFSGDEVRVAVEALNGFPPLRDPAEHVCNAAMWPGYVLLVEHTDGTVTALTADRSCGLVSDGAGAVRIGLPDVVADS